MYTLDFWNLPGILALISGFLVVGQLILTLFHGGIDTDLDVDGDGFGDFDLGAILSPKGILHFIFGASWYLVLIQPYRPDRNWFAYDWFIAIGVGVLVSFLVVPTLHLVSSVVLLRPSSPSIHLRTISLVFLDFLGYLVLSTIRMVVSPARKKLPHQMRIQRYPQMRLSQVRENKEKKAKESI